MPACAASMLESAAEVEAPFWGRFLSSQMLSYFYENRINLLQAASMRTQRPSIALAHLPTLDSASSAATTYSPVLSPAAAHALGHEHEGAHGLESPPMHADPEQRARLAAAKRAARDARLMAANARPHGRHTGAAADTLRRLSAAIDIRNVTLGPASFSQAVVDAGNTFGYPPTIATGGSLSQSMRRSTMWAPATPQIATATVAIKSREAQLVSPPPPPARGPVNSLPVDGAAKGIVMQSKHARRHTAAFSPSAVAAAGLPPKSGRPPAPAASTSPRALPSVAAGESGSEEESETDSKVSTESGRPHARTTSDGRITGVIGDSDEEMIRVRARTARTVADAVVSTDEALEVAIADVKGWNNRRATLSAHPAGSPNRRPVRQSYADTRHERSFSKEQD
jgi:hypothetical protein